MISRLFCAVMLTLITIACGPSDDSGDLRPEKDVSEVLPASKNINILFITFDALRADRLAPYGGNPDLTPRMNEFAANAVIFANAYVAGQATPSSFASSFTGQYPFRVFREWMMLETQTLAKIFRNAGYRTWGFFNNQQLAHERNYRQGFEEFQVTVNQQDTPPLNAIADLLSDPGERPFFAWVHFINPHSAYDYRPGSKAFYDPDYRGPYQKTSGARVQSYNLDELAQEDLAHIRQLYDGEVHFADRRFGEVIDLLEKSGLTDRTLVILSADHGESMGEHGFLGHHKLYEQVIRVPMVVRHPQGAAGRIVNTPVMNIDLLPTLADIAGVDHINGILDGINLRETLAPDRAMLFTQMTNPGQYSMAMRQGADKFLIWCVDRYDPAEEFYDLAADPGETTNLIHAPEYAEKADRMFKDWKTMIGGEHPCTVIEGAINGASIESNMDEDALEKLRSLGYIQ